MRALTFGSFDLLHYGHMRLLARIAEVAEYVIVGLATDELVVACGKVAPVYPYKIRREMLLHTRYVDEVVEHAGPIDGEARVKVIAHKIELVRTLSADMVVMGDDWAGEYDFLMPLCSVRYLPRTPDIASSSLRQHLT